MEPITTCITYLNILCGYYYWAMTETDYEIEAMIYWIKNIDPILAKDLRAALREQRPSVSSVDVLRHEKFNEEFGFKATIADDDSDDE